MVVKTENLFAFDEQAISLFWSWDITYIPAIFGRIFKKKTSYVMSIKTFQHQLLNILRRAWSLIIHSKLESFINYIENQTLSKQKVFIQRL